MIQRIQTIWLLLATVFSGVTMKLEFYAGTKLDNTPGFLNAIEPSLLLTILTVAMGVCSLITIFLFKDVRLQIKLTLATLLASLILLVLYFLELKTFATGTISIWAIFYFGIPVCLVLALIGMRKDQKIIRDMDRLR